MPANVPISGLPAAGSCTGPDLMAIVQSGTTKKATLTQLAALMTSTIALATPSAQGAMSAADKIKLNSATTSLTGNSISQRDSSGQGYYYNLLLGSTSTPGVNSGAIAFGAGAGPIFDSQLAGTIRCQGAFLSMGLLSCNGDATIGVAPGSGTLTVNNQIVCTWPSSVTTINGENVNTKTLFALNDISTLGFINCTGSCAVNGTFHYGLYTAGAVACTGTVAFVDSAGNARRFMIG